MSGVRVPPPLLATDSDHSCQNPPPQGTCVESDSSDCDPAPCQDEPLRAATGPQGATRLLSDDPDLTRVIDRSENLPSAVRAGIVAIVKASGQGND